MLARGSLQLTLGASSSQESWSFNKLWENHLLCTLPCGALSPRLVAGSPMAGAGGGECSGVIDRFLC